MAKIVVITTAADEENAGEFAQSLREFGLKVGVLMLEGEPASEIASHIPDDAFVAFCMSETSVADLEMRALITEAIRPGPAERFIFVAFSQEAVDDEELAAIFEQHPVAFYTDAQSIAEHISVNTQGEDEEAAAESEAAEEHEDETPDEEPEPRELPRTAAPPPIDAAPQGQLKPSPEDFGMKAAKRDPKEDIADDAAAASVGGASAAWETAMRNAEPPPPPPPAPPPVAAPAPRASIPAPPNSGAAPVQRGKLDKVDAQAFAPKKLRRRTPELIRVAVYVPADRKLVERDAKRADPHTEHAGSAQTLGQITRGAVISAHLNVRGGDADEHRLNAVWTGEPLTFDFAVTADSDAEIRQALITIRVTADDAQLGAITFVRKLSRAQKKPKPTKLTSREKLRRVNRVFLSYASFDRDQVSLIASAYDRAGLKCFYDRATLKSGEEWSPRLRREIEKADLFHLCWSRAASGSQWVEAETQHAMQRRRKSKKPEITIQMLDGPPWAPHPDSLDTLNFDDYARAAVVGYARGEK